MEILNTVSFLFMSLAGLAFIVIPIKYPDKLKKYLWLIVIIYLIGMSCSVFSAFISSEQITEEREKNDKLSDDKIILNDKVQEFKMKDSLRTESVKEVYKVLNENENITRKSKDSLLISLEDFIPKDSLILGDDDRVEVTRGNLIKLSIIGYEISSKCGDRWICFVDNDHVWPQVKVSFQTSIKSVSIPSDFNRGKLVLACISNANSKRRFNSYLRSLNFSYITKPSDFKIIFQSEIIIK